MGNEKSEKAEWHDLEVRQTDRDLRNTERIWLTKKSPKCGGKGATSLPRCRNRPPICTSPLPFALYCRDASPTPAPGPHPEAGAVRVGPNEAETIARNILASHSKSDDGGGVPGQEVLGGGEGGD